jgi:hypothetical protein
LERSGFANPDRETGIINGRMESWKNGKLEEWNDGTMKNRNNGMME